MAPPKKVSARGFEGFADTTGKFFRDLAKRQDRAWFAEHKSDYVDGWEQPMRALLGEVRARIDGAYPDCELADPKVFRIHRDVRFGTDKSPYKAHVAGVLGIVLGGKITETPAALYLQLGVESFAGAGLYMMDKTQLARFRAALLDDARGAELAKLVNKLEGAGYAVASFESLAKAPRGVAADHPRIALLRRKGLVVSIPTPTGATWTSRELVAELAAHAKKVAPLVRWLAYNVAA